MKSLSHAFSETGFVDSQRAFWETTVENFFWVLIGAKEQWSRQNPRVCILLRLKGLGLGLGVLSSSIVPTRQRFLKKGVVRAPSTTTGLNCLHGFPKRQAHSFVWGLRFVKPSLITLLIHSALARYSAVSGASSAMEAAPHSPDAVSGCRCRGRRQCGLFEASCTGICVAPTSQGGQDEGLGSAAKCLSVHFLLCL